MKRRRRRRRRRRMRRGKGGVEGEVLIEDKCKHLFFTQIDFMVLAYKAYQTSKALTKSKFAQKNF